MEISRSQLPTLDLCGLLFHSWICRNARNDWVESSNSIKIIAKIFIWVKQWNVPYSVFRVQTIKCSANVHIFPSRSVHMHEMYALLNSVARIIACFTIKIKQIQNAVCSPAWWFRCDQLIPTRIPLPSETCFGSRMGAFMKYSLNLRPWLWRY